MKEGTGNQNDMAMGAKTTVQPALAWPYRTLGTEQFGCWYPRMCLLMRWCLKIWIGFLATESTTAKVAKITVLHFFVRLCILTGRFFDLLIGPPTLHSIFRVHWTHQRKIVSVLLMRRELTPVVNQPPHRQRQQGRQPEQIADGEAETHGSGGLGFAQNCWKPVRIVIGDADISFWEGASIRPISSSVQRSRVSFM